MGVTVIMLGAALGPTGFLGYTGLGSTELFPGNFPAWCLYHPQISWADNDGRELLRSYNIVYVAIAMFILGFSYVTRVVQLSSETSNWVKGAFRTRPSKVIKRLVDQLKSRSDHATPYRVVLPVFGVFIIKAPHFSGVS